MGLRAITLKRMENYIRVVQGLLAGETVDWSEEGGTHKIRFLNPELELIKLDDPIPLHVSAFGPRGRRLTAKLGAGWMGAMRNAQSANAALADMQAAWKEAGRDAKDLYATAFGGGCVLADGEPADSPRAKAQAGPAAAIAFHAYAEADELGALFPGAAAVAGEVRRLSRGLSQVPAGGCALSAEPPRPSDVPAAGGAGVHHRRRSSAASPSPARARSWSSSSRRSRPPAIASSASMSATATRWRCSRTGPRWWRRSDGDEHSRVARPASAPIPRFASYRGEFDCELRNQRSTSNSMILVRL